MNANHIGNNIMKYLKEQNKTQVDLANGLNTSKQIINKIIKGRKALKTSELIAISKFLNVSLEDIIEENNEEVLGEVEAAHLYGEINKETADFIIELVNNLSAMEEELAVHGLLK